MMNIFSRMCFVSVAGMVLVWGMSTACADGGEKQADGKPVTAETRKQIVKTLFDVVRDKDAKVGVRVSAVRGLGEQASDMRAVQAEVLDALMEIIKNQNADPRLQLEATRALREADVELTKKQLETIGKLLWEIAIEYAEENVEEEMDDNDTMEIAVVAVNELNEYAIHGHPFPLPNVAAMHAVLDVRKYDSVVRYQGETYDRFDIGSQPLFRLDNSEQGVRLLIEAIESLKEGGSGSQRIVLIGYLEDVAPHTEGIAQLLLKAASHENPDVRAAAIEALGNEVPESDGGAAPISPDAPE